MIAQIYTQRFVNANLFQRNDPLKNDPLKNDPLKNDPLKNDPLKNDPLKNDPLKNDPLNNHKANNEALHFAVECPAGNHLTAILTRLVALLSPSDQGSVLIPAVLTCLFSIGIAVNFCGYNSLARFSFGTMCCNVLILS